MRRKLTDAAVKKLKPPPSGQLDVFDAGYPGLALRISYGGSRTWVYFCRPGGKLVRHQLGTYPTMSLSAARSAWRTAKDEVDAGRPPTKVPKAPRRRAQAADGSGPVESPDAIEVVVRDWLRRDQASNSTYGEVKAVFDKLIVPEWKGRHIGSICRRDVIAILDSAVDRGRIGRARHLHAFLNRFFNWCVGRGIIDASPMAQLPKPGEAVARDRVLSDAEIRAFWRACKTIGPPFGCIGQLLLLTAARRSEIAELRHDEVDADGASIRLGGVRTKNQEAHVIPLSPLAWRVLSTGLRIADSPYVFPSGRGKTPFSAWSKTKAALDREMRLNAHWTLHDLRRTAATNLERLGVPLPVTEACLGHTSGSKSGIVKVYQTYRFEAEKREALNRWADRVLELVA